MIIPIEDILAALCSRVELSHATEAQKIYLLSDRAEAKLASELLAVHGFDIRLYDEPDLSRLYITQPQPSMDLAPVLAMARLLKRIQQDIGMVRDGNVSPRVVLSGAPGGVKQIVIQLSPPQPAVKSDHLPPHPVHTAQPGGKAVKKTSNPSDSFAASGPSVGKTAYADGRPRVTRRPIKEPLIIRLYQHFGGHAAGAGFMLLSAFLVFIACYSVFILAKSYICPDFASMQRNTAWYCRNP